MRIDRIRIDGFGRLTDFDTGGSALGDLVVVVGPNEAGKSTLFTFLTTALYGFVPASRERNPHVPWGADEASGRLALRLDGGGCAEIERRLRSQPSGILTIDGAGTDLRNQALPWVEHVPRTVFRQVFAITLSDLAGLDSETWARIQDKVVGAMGASDLRSARDVAEALESEAGEIWRPNRRGNQRLRDLQSESRALRIRRADAVERDGRIRALVDEGDRTRGLLQEAREQRQRLRLSLERTQALVPLRRQRDRIASLREEGGSRAPLERLPPDPPARFAELVAEERRLLERRERLEAELADRDAEVCAFDGRAKRLLAAREEVARLVVRVAGGASDRERAAETEAEIHDLERDLDATAETLLERDWREVTLADVASVPVELLRDRVARTRPAPPTVRPKEGTQGRTGPMVGVLLAGLALLAWGGLRASVPVSAVGAALTAIALTLLVVTRRRARAAAASEASAREAASAEIRTALAPIPIRAEHLERPGDHLVRSLSRLQALLRERDRRIGAVEAARERAAEVEHEVARLARTLGVASESTATETGEALAHAIDFEVRRAERLEHAAVTAEREARRLEGERAAVLAALEGLAPELEALHRAGEMLVPGDASAGLAVALERLVAHRRADELEEELERAHPGLEAAEADMDDTADGAQARAADDERLALARARVEGLEEEIERLVKRAEAIAHDTERLRELETVDAVDSEIASLAEQQARLARERDRKWVIAKLLREADRRFREEHQPDLLRRASSYLRHLTAGRYERLVVDERGDGDLFQVVGPGLPAPVALAAPVSTGTLEQAYLSLRLAIVDHLDQGGERLPLFIDEVLVNWDRGRRARGLEVIASVSEVRQVFVFTCHEGLARELEARGARLLALGIR